MPSTLCTIALLCCYSYVHSKGNIEDVANMEGWKAGHMYPNNRQKQSAKDISQSGMQANLKHMPFPYEGWKDIH